jgi:DMSO reductase family type II enzyme heme b subunit
MLLVVAAMTPSLGASAQDGSSFISAKYHAGEPPLDPFDLAWSRVVPVVVSVYPQVSVAPRIEPTGAATVNVRAIYGSKMLGLHLEWPNPKPAQNRAIGAFADAAAIQWPVQYGPGKMQPYVGMGHAGAPVAFWFWRADDTVETLAAGGFGTLTVQPNDGVRAKGIWKDGVWHVVFVRSLGVPHGDYRVRFDPVRQGLVPFALAVWSGGAEERSGLKRLSAWHVLRFEKTKSSPSYVRELVDPLLGGNAVNGKRLMVKQGCAACHAFPGNSERPSVGPDLTYAGGIHSKQYLLQSLREPSRVLVPGKLHTTVEDGKRVSVMPPFAGSEEELRDIVAYLKTLR